MVELIIIAAILWVAWVVGCAMAGAVEEALPVIVEEAKKDEGGCAVLLGLALALGVGGVVAILA